MMQVFLWRLLQLRIGAVKKKSLLRPTVIIAPHQDDEVLGCGGTIARLRQCGVSVTIIFLSDGANSHSNKMAPEMMAQLRNREALNAAAIMGVEPKNVHFIPICNHGHPVNSEHADKLLLPLLESIPADNYFIPYRHEQQLDHANAATVSLSVIDKLKKDTLIMEYPIWFWEHRPWMTSTIFSPSGFFDQARHSVRSLWRLFAHFNYYVDVTEMRQLKKTALSAYESQMTRFENDATWPILPDVSSGDFLNCLNRDKEIFSCSWHLGNTTRND